MEVQKIQEKAKKQREEYKLAEMKQQLIQTENEQASEFIFQFFIELCISKIKCKFVRKSW